MTCSNGQATRASFSTRGLKSQNVSPYVWRSLAAVIVAVRAPWSMRAMSPK